MVKTYSSVSSSIDLKSIGSILKFVMGIALILILAGELYKTFFLGDTIHTDYLWHGGTVAIAGIFSFVQIMGYSKRNIVRIVKPTGSKRGITETLKTVLMNPVDLILVPAFAGVMLYLPLSMIFDSGLAPLSIIFVVIYLIQLLPLSVKKEKYTRVAHSAIDEAKFELKSSRIIMTTPDLSEYEHEQAIDKHIAAEEMLTVHSDFLVHSSGLMATLIMGIRYSMPLMTTVGGIILKPLLG